MCNFNNYSLKGGGLLGLFLEKKTPPEFITGNGFKMINLQIKCNSKQNDKLCGLIFGWQGNPEAYKIQIK